MFHIVVAMFSVLTGQIIDKPLVLQEPSFATMEQCEAERTGKNFTSAVNDLAKALKKKGADNFQIKTKCFEFKAKPSGESI